MAFKMGLIARRSGELRVRFEGEFVELSNVFICSELVSEEVDAFCIGSRPSSEIGFSF